MPEFPSERDKAHLSARESDDTAPCNKVILVVGVIGCSKSRPTLEGRRDTGGVKKESLTLEKKVLESVSCSSSSEDSSLVLLVLLTSRGKTHRNCRTGILD